MKVELAAGVTLDIQGIHDLAPTLWLDFINADLQNAKSMWTIYKEFVRDMEDLKEWLDNEGYSHELKDMRLLSREEFLYQYEGLQVDVKKSHSKMMALINEEKNEVMGDMAKHPNGGGITKDADIQPLSITVTINDFSSAEMTGEDYPLHLRTMPKANHPNFWLSTILGSMISSYRTGKMARRCAAPDCGRYFIPSPRSHDQRYHSPACQNRHYKRKRRSRS